MLSIGHRTYHLHLPPSMAAVHPQFYTSLLKPIGPQPAGPPTLADDFYAVEAIFQIKKHKTYDKVK